MIIAFSLSTITSANAESVPEWVKNNAGWWANEQISDSAFIECVYYYDIWKKHDDGSVFKIS